VTATLLASFVDKATKQATMPGDVTACTRAVVQHKAHVFIAMIFASRL
jgi:hypothetical protein